MFWFIILDAVVAVLLAATIVYAIVLNRKLGHLRGNRSEVEQSAAGFHDAVARAEASVAKLKVSTDTLRQQVDRAQSLKDDLTLLIERGNSVADALEAAVRAGRQQRDASPRPRPVAVPQSAGAGSARPPSASAAPRTEAERELLKALAVGR